MQRARCMGLRVGGPHLVQVDSFDVQVLPCSEAVLRGGQVQPWQPPLLVGLLAHEVPEPEQLPERLRLGGFDANVCDLGYRQRP